MIPAIPVAEAVEADGANLHCPYPACDGSINESELVSRVVECPTCHRLAARCLRIGVDGVCRTLNRPLARFCRHCHHEFASGWAESLWVADTLESRADSGKARGPTELRLGSPESVIHLSDWLPPDPYHGWPMELLASAGRLWLGASDGRYLIVEPFQDRTDRTVLREPIWPGPRTRLRACASGYWMLLYSERGIKALNLLTLDEPHPDAERHFSLWEAKEGQRLVASPILIEGASGEAHSFTGQQRTAVWLTHEKGQGLVLCAASLPLLAERTALVPRRGPLVDERSQAILPADDNEQVLLLRAPFDHKDRVLVCTRAGLWMVDVLKAMTGAFRVRTVLSGRPLVTWLGDSPGVVFVPGELSAATGNRPEAEGRVFVACQQGSGRRLHELSLSADGGSTIAPYGNYGGVPIAPAESSGIRGILCHEGQTLTLCNWSHNQIPCGSYGYLDGLARVNVYGRVALGSGTVTEGVQGHPFVVLVDLERGQVAASLVLPEGYASHPVMIGHSLFLIQAITRETPPEEGGHLRPGLHLTRRTLIVQEPGAAPK